jgi:hypothetical protein
MPKEVQEELFLKWNTQEVKQMKAFYTPTTVPNVVETWKRKSVSIISPKSGRVLRQKDRQKPNEKKTRQDPKDVGFFARLFDDFKKAKVSDYEYQQSKIRENTSYKPFWATKVVGAKDKTENAMNSEDTIKTISYTVNNNALANKTMVFQKETLSPKVILTKKAFISKHEKPQMQRISTVDQHREYKLKMPPYYKGSKMFMPTGEQLFWVGTIIGINKSPLFKLGIS